MAGQWPQARCQQIGSDGLPAVGLRAYFYAGGTSTPLTTYSHPSLGEANENAAYVETDGNGRFPPVFFDEADEFYRVRVTESDGTVIYDDDPVPIFGPPTSEGGGSEVPVSASALLDTGDIKARYGTGALDGFVRANGRTIGSATSGASERANADTEDLFLYLYGVDSNLSVSGGRGANAAADWAANKTIALPDFRGRTIVALDDMGNTAAGILTDVTTLGEVGGSEDYTLVAGDIPELSGTTSSGGSHSHKMFADAEGNGTSPPEQYAAAQESNFGGDYNYQISDTSTTPSAGDTSTASAHTHTVTVGDSSPDAISLLQPYIGLTIYIKL